MAGTHEDLIIWQRSLKVTFDIYQLTDKLPSTERYGLSSQMRRCAVSVPSNIAEGYCRFSQKDFKRFLGIALGSVAELQTQLLIVQEVYNLESKNMQEELIEIAKMIRAFIRTLP